MKKVLLPVLLLLFAFTVLAQTKKIEFGFQGGINLNTVYGSGISKEVKGNITGSSIGGNAKWNTTNWFGIRVQLSYDQMGYALRNLYLEDSVNGLAKADVRFKLNYLNLPVMAEFTFGKKVKFMLDAGGFVGVLLNSKATVNRVLPNGDQSLWYSFPSTGYKKLNAGLAAGLGIQVPLTSKIALTLNARNDAGLTNISNSSAGYAFSRKTKTFSFLSGISFQL